MAEKKVKMVIKVNLQCYRCYKKIKKVMCKFPEIRDQIYNEKQNSVTISVVSCCPERILEKIARNGGKTVESIEIVPEKQPEQPKKKPEKPKKEEKPKKKEREPNDIDSLDDKPPSDNGDKYIAQPVSARPMIYTSGTYYQPPQQYYQGYSAMPYYHGVPAYYGESSYGVNRGYNMNRTDYFSEKNPESCTVM